MVTQTIGDINFFGFGLDGYKAHDQAQHSSNANITYYGFLNRLGEWYIMEQTISGTTFSYRFAKGSSAYTTNWTNRESLTYGYLNVIFA